MKNIKITVSGEAMSGNSYLVHEIRKLLRENGWSVEHDYDSEDNQTEIDLDKCLDDNLNTKINNVKNNVIITINEKQLQKVEN